MFKVGDTVRVLHDEPMLGEKGNLWSKGDKAVVIGIVPGRAIRLNFNNQGNPRVAYDGLWYARISEVELVTE